MSIGNKDSSSQETCACQIFAIALNNTNSAFRRDESHFFIGDLCICYCPFCGRRVPPADAVRIPQPDVEEEKRFGEMFKPGLLLSSIPIDKNASKRIGPEVQYYENGEYKWAETVWFSSLSENYEVELWVDRDRIISLFCNLKGLQPQR